MSQHVPCQQCGDLFATSGSLRAGMAFCKAKCRKARNRDLLEYIGADGVIQYYQNPAHAEAFLHTLPPCNVRLDLHKVLDTVPSTPFPPHIVSADNVCAISYVGPLTLTRIGARQDIQDRIASGQIAFGLLVFKRAPRRSTDDEKNSFHAPGSKAWVNQHLPLAPNTPAIFIDDSYDHYASVTALQLPTLATVHLTEGLNLLQTLRGGAWRQRK